MYNDIKTGFSELIGISKDALHIHLGLAIFVAVVLLFRRSPSSLWPWLAVLAFELVNELVDAFHWSAGVLDIDLPGAIKDIGNTMLWPTVALIAFRLWEKRTKPPVPPQA